MEIWPPRVRSLPCAKGGGIFAKNDGGIAEQKQRSKTIPHPTSSYAPFTQGSRGAFTTEMCAFVKKSKKPAFL